MSVELRTEGGDFEEEEGRIAAQSDAFLTSLLCAADLSGVF